MEKQYIKSIIAITLFLLISLATTSSRAKATDKRHQQFCANYANTAVIQQLNNLKNKCGFKGLRWSPLYQAQYQWCLTVRLSIASNETKIRKNRLKQNCGVNPLGKFLWKDVDYWQRDKIIKDAIKAVEKDDVMSLKIFKYRGVNLAHEWDGNFGTPLYHAITKQKNQAVHYLIHFDSPDRTTNGGAHPLATMLENTKVDYTLLEFLLRKGMKPNGNGERSDALSSPLFVAINKGDMRALRLLLKYGAKPNNPSGMISFLIEAIKRNRVDAVKLLLQYGAKVNMSEGNMTCHNLFGSGQILLPLDYALQKGNKQIINLLKIRGAKRGYKCK